jgi:hypothetical protein
MLHLHLTRHPDLKGLPEIQKQFERHGGRVVLFQQVTSAVVVSWGSAHLEWVPPHATRTGRGLRYAFWTALLGWWSLSGLWCTPAAILTDLFGGVDVTDLVKTSTPPQNRPKIIAKAEAVVRNREYYLLILELVLLFVGIMVWIAYAPIPFGRKNH